ncbi:ATP-binding protein [Nonomuraea sp. SMC257]|uniref:ATP-binding protein n=1 Tax=Nonomuraea montanisoli TaxID=2741721 RepID=A0A7Y6M588_9ACTN|nr:ATP-binding protein [Nonomuraea montanisoli]NUW34295.1 ATP-binding protein [Nonomuraea montanisoli]
MTFTEADVAGARGAVERFALAHGLADERAVDLVLAVNEAVVNAIAYADGRGVLRLWRDGDSVMCEIRDYGSGISGRTLDKEDPPPMTSAGGWGIWLIRRLADKVAITTGPDGTAVRIAMSLPGREREAT